MVDIQTLRKLLAEEYGIRSDHELLEAIEKMGKIDIGVFISPLPQREDRRANDGIQQKFNSDTKS